MSTATTTALPAATWGVDPVHSTAGFAIKYMVSTFKADFAKVDVDARHHGRRRRS